MSDLAYRVAMLEQIVANLIRPGTVVAVGDDFERASVTFAPGQRTAMLKVFQPAASDVNQHTPIAVGEQVVVLSPNGDTNCGYVLRGLHGGGNAAPSISGTTDVRTYPDGTALSYDWEGHTLTLEVRGAAVINTTGPATVKAIGPLTLLGASIAMSSADGGTCPATLVGNFKMIGTLSVQGDISASGTIMDGGGNSNHHKH